MLGTLLPLLIHDEEIAAVPTLVGLLTTEIHILLRFQRFADGPLPCEDCAGLGTQ